MERSRLVRFQFRAVLGARNFRLIRGFSSLARRFEAITVSIVFSC